MVRLLLIRHAATAVTGNNVLLGSTDVEASVAGLQQLERLPGLLENHRPDLWFCSPMHRAVQTVEYLHDLYSKDLKFQKDERLREIDFGRWEQKSFDEIETSDPELIPAWSQYKDFVFPEGEAVDEFIGRVKTALDEFKGMDGKEIGVIAHGGVIRTMICLALGLDPKNYLLFTISPASLTILDLYPEGGVLTGMNM